MTEAAPFAGGIFISYRRDDAAYPAGWLVDRLASRFGADRVFKDVDSIQLGDDFVEAIMTAVGSCAVLLAVIGARWLAITGEDGRRRIDDPEDFVRLEIEAALALNVRVIPVLVDGGRMPSAADLPAGLQGLARRQALELSPANFDTSRLLAVLESTLPRITATDRANRETTMSDIQVTFNNQDRTQVDGQFGVVHGNVHMGIRPGPAGASSDPTPDCDDGPDA